MSYSGTLCLTGEWCDKCRKPLYDKNPGLSLYASSREGGRHIIFIHIACLEKSVARAKDALRALIPSEQPKEETSA